jgi:hypothetical protein
MDSAHCNAQSTEAEQLFLAIENLRLQPAIFAEPSPNHFDSELEMGLASSPYSIQLPPISPLECAKTASSTAAHFGFTTPASTTGPMPIHIFIDNSYMFIEGQKASARALQLTARLDPRIRFNMNKVLSVITGDRVVASQRLYGSEAGSLSSVWNSAKKSAMDVHVFRRSVATGKEKFVNTKIVNDLCELMWDVHENTHAVIAVLTGDQTVVAPCRELLTSSAVQLELYAYEQSVSTQFHELAQQFPDRVRLIKLESMLREITFMSTLWDEQRKVIPSERTLAMTVKSVLRHERTHVDGDSDATHSPKTSPSYSPLSSPPVRRSSNGLSSSPITARRDEQASPAKHSPHSKGVDVQSREAIIASIDAYGRARFIEAVVSAFTTALKLPTMACMRDATVLVPVVPSEGAEAYSFAALMQTHDVKQDVSRLLAAQGLVFDFEVAPLEQSLAAKRVLSDDHSKAFSKPQVPRGGMYASATMHAPAQHGYRDQRKGAYVAQPQVQVQTQAHSYQARSMAGAQPHFGNMYSQQYPQQYSQQYYPQYQQSLQRRYVGDDWQHLQGHAMFGAQQHAKAAPPCMYGSKCKHGLHCQYAHTEADRAQFRNQSPVY